MKKATLITAMVLFTTLGFAQERIKEVGLSFSNLNNFGLNYKVGTHQKLWRFNSAAGSIYNIDETYLSSETERKGFGASFSGGREFRKNIADDFEFRYGLDLSFSFGRSKSESQQIDNPGIAYNEKQQSFSTGANAVFGINYLIKGKIVIGGELLPGLSHRRNSIEKHNITTNETEEQKTSRLDFGFGSSSVLLVLAYRFGTR